MYFFLIVQKKVKALTGL